MAFFRLRFVTEDALDSALIRWETRCLYSHIDIVMPDGQYLGARHKGGVAIRPVDYMRPTRERRYAIPVEDNALAAMMTFGMAQVGKPYDDRDIIGMALHTDWHSADSTAWICSELGMAYPLAGGLALLNVLAGYTYRITPDDLHLSPLLIARCYYSA